MRSDFIRWLFRSLALLVLGGILPACGSASGDSVSDPSSSTEEVVDEPTQAGCNVSLYFTASVTFAPAWVDASTIQAAIDELNAYVPLEERCLHPVPTFDTNFTGSTTTLGNGTSELLFGAAIWNGPDRAAGLATLDGVPVGIAIDGTPHYFPITEADIDIDGSLDPIVYEREEYICVVAHEFAHVMGYEHEDKIYRVRSGGGLGLGHCAEAKLNALDHASCNAFAPDSREYSDCHWEASLAATRRHYHSDR